MIIGRERKFETAIENHLEDSRKANHSLSLCRHGYVVDLVRDRLLRTMGTKCHDSPGPLPGVRSIVMEAYLNGRTT